MGLCPTPWRRTFYRHFLLVLCKCNQSWALWNIFCSWQYKLTSLDVTRLLLDVLPEPINQDQPLIAYVGDPDIRYYILLVAAVKAGYSVTINDAPALKWANVFETLLPSLDLEGKAKTHLLKILDCSILVHSSDDPNNLGFEPSFLSQTVKLPSLQTLIDSAPIEPFPYCHSFEDVENNRFVVNHATMFPMIKINAPYR